jgi:hypothetical protein
MLVQSLSDPGEESARCKKERPVVHGLSSSGGGRREVGPADGPAYGEAGAKPSTVFSDEVLVHCELPRKDGNQRQPYMCTYPENFYITFAEPCSSAQSNCLVDETCALGLRVICYALNHLLRLDIL